MIDTPDPEAVLRLAIGLVAFVLAYFALIARDRRTPYAAFRAHLAILLGIGSVLCSFVAHFLAPRSEARAVMAWIGVGLLAMALLRTIEQVVTVL